jgi:plasmid stabilization system protein ParE
MTYRLSPLAEEDLDEIWSYVAEHASPTTADRLIDAIIDRFDLLAEHPGIGRARPVAYDPPLEVIAADGSPDRQVTSAMRPRRRVDRLFADFTTVLSTARGSRATCREHSRS